jgi:hypothetical protein
VSDQSVRAVELAIAAAGTMDNTWRKRVYDNLAEVSVMLREGSEALDWSERLLQATTFKATYTGYEEEKPESMGGRVSRLIVNTQSDQAINEKPGPRQNLTGEEHVRTDPLWTRPGRLVADRIRALPVGSLILVYKLTEDVDGDRKSRVLLHFEVLKTPAAGSTAAPAAGSERPVEEPPSLQDEAPEQSPPAAAPEPHSHDDNAALTQIEKLFDQLNGSKRVAYSHWCRNSGIQNPMVPEPDETPQAIAMLERLGGES